MYSNFIYNSVNNMKYSEHCLVIDDTLPVTMIPNG